MTGSDLIVKILIESGVTVCFGYPGGAAMPLYDALYKKRDVIRHVRTAHEQGASHAADGYARASGKLGVCIATSGPGATNLVTGIATAFSDSSHVLFITANVDSSQVGTDSFQEADIAGITTPVCKYNWTVRDPFSLEIILRKAIRLSTEGRPGPVLVDIPHDILSYDFPRSYISGKYDDSLCEARSPVIPEVPTDTVGSIVKMIKGSKRPLIIAGGGVIVSGAATELTGLARKGGIHVATTLMARGILPSGDPLDLGMVGAYGDPRAIAFAGGADLIIAVGMRFSNRTHGYFPDGTPIIHIDSDCSELDKNVKVTLPVCGDAKKVLAAVLEVFDDIGYDPESRPEATVVRPVKQAKKEQIIPDISGGSLYPGNTDRLVGEVFDMISDKLGDVFVVTDVGIHQMATARLYPFERPGRLITSGGFGTMGFGIGADIGATIAAKENSQGRPGSAVLITGDGSFRMSIAELASVRENGIKTLIVVINNRSLGMVRDIQKKSFGRRYIATDAAYRIPDIRKVAGAYGLAGFVAKDIGSFEKAIDSYIHGEKTVVVDLRV
ncbi:MAG: thiamine pyrophosphate-binding protein [Clostridia bacterium]|nr:thiamine pyrophosphate-binding protein [Clostridia bacterium]